MTPDAGEGTSLEEDGNTDAGAIVDGIAFDVKDQGLHSKFFRGDCFVPSP